MTDAVSLGGISNLRDLMQQICFEFGDYDLSSGHKSKYYYDGKHASLWPRVLFHTNGIGNLLVDVVLRSGAEAVGGIEIGSVPISLAVGEAALDQDKDLPTFIVRKEAKKHGSRDKIAQAHSEDGKLLTSGRKVAIVDDVITTGGSIRKAIVPLEDLGCIVTIIAVLVERHEGGGETLRAEGYDVVSLFLADEDGNLTVNENFIERLASVRAGVA